MNNIIIRKNFLALPGLAALAILGSGISVNAQTVSEKTQLSNQVAQADTTTGKSNQSPGSYVGIGTTIGVTGGFSALSDGNFSFISKIRFTKSLSVRPSAILGSDTTFLVPLTYDFSIKPVDPFTETVTISPYIGVGAVIKTAQKSTTTDDKSETAVLVTGGVDVPLGQRFTATAAVNAGFFNQTDVGILLGVGYNFKGF
ncbi:hypothetical protein H6G25_17215 [Dolichospermum sp. FACHB-1091]|uniref:hypothetical protein n=1 Tax=Dolichospermum sp. FACHB-1091 TaxID=2692798 RepID=UPI0016806EEA|nr:hypothetical protein [Dolichospermum sp. FACHB-1091]MBD2444892.1 hypothetical protein [Dolichospermum sp. FACHB-1091]